ncbi:MAG: FkbM family methyltransferase [Reinekea sp.]
MLKPILKRILGPQLKRSIKKFLGRQQLEEVDLIYGCLKDDNIAKVMVDVGGHHGGSLECFAFDGWRIYAFEPDPKNRAILKSFCQNMPNVSIDSRAVSNQDENEKPFFNSNVSSGISSLSSFHTSHKQVGTVSTVTLTTFFQENNISNVGFLKIDTEGHDLFVLKGVPWKDVMPEVVLCEFEDRKTVPLGYDFNDMASFLVDKGYQVLVSEWFPIIEYGSRHRWRRFAKYPCKLQDENAWGNIIAVKDDVRMQNILRLSEIFLKRFGD